MDFQFPGSYFEIGLEDVMAVIPIVSDQHPQEMEL